MTSMALETLIEPKFSGIQHILDTLKTTTSIPIAPLDPISQARAYLRYKNWPDAFDAWQKLHEEDPHNLDTLMILAKVAIKIGKHEYAVELIDGPTKIYLKEARFEAAIILARRLISWQPSHAPFHERLLHLYEVITKRLKGSSKRRYFAEQALETLRKMVHDRRIKVHPRNKIRWLLAISKKDPRDIRTAKAIVKLIAKHQSRERAINFICTLADHLLSKGHFDAADRMLEVGHRLDATDFNLRYLYYLSEAHKGRPNKALNGLLELHRQEPNNLTVIRALALLDLRFHRIEKAVNWLLILFHQDKSTENRLLNTGHRLLNEGKTACAFQLFKALAQYHADQGNIGIAIRLMTHIHQQDPQHQETLEMLGGYYLYVGRNEDANHFLDQAFGYYLQETEPEMGQVLVRTFLKESPRNKHLIMWYRKFKKATQRLIEEGML